jgi:hypothetical protein
VRSIAEKVIEKTRKQVHIVRHPEDVPVNHISVHCMWYTGLPQSWFTLELMVHEFKSVA